MVSPELQIRELLGLTDKEPGARRIQIVSELAHRGYRLRNLVIESEPGIAIPAVEILPEAPDPQTPIVLKAGADRTVELAQGGPVERLAQSGRRVVLADLRGMGATAPTSPRDRGESLMGTDTKEAFLSLHIGRPLLGQRVFDLICLLETLESREGSPAATGFDVTGIGPAGLAVLHAAALNEKGLIKHVILELRWPPGPTSSSEVSAALNLPAWFPAFWRTMIFPTWRPGSILVR